MKLLDPERLKQLDAWHRLARRLPWLVLPLRFLSYVAYRGLELVLGAGHPHERVARQARRLERGSGAQRPTPAATTSRRVLFFTVRGWYAHVTTEAILAKAVEQRGADVHFFLCGGPLEQCDFKPATDPHVTRPLCWRCVGFARRVLGGFDLPWSELSEHVPDGAREQIRDRLDGLGLDQLQDFEYQGLPVGQYVLPSVQRSLLRGDIAGDPWSHEVLRGFVESACLMVHVAAELLAQKRPDVVVLTNGTFFAERVMLQLARNEGCEVIAYERGMRLDSVVLARGEPVVPFNLDEHWDRMDPKALTAAEDDALDGYLAARARGNVGVQQLWPSMEADGDAVLQRLGVGRDRSIAVLFTNVLWDSAVFRRDRAFDSMFDWVRSTIGAFRDLPERQLLIRVHPAEMRVPMLESRDRLIDNLRAADIEIPPNVRIVPPDDPASSYALMAVADSVLTYTSTIGLEAAVRGLRVVTAGRTHYARHGFTVDVDDRSRYRQQVIDALSAGPLNDQELRRARAYAYLFFFLFTRPFPWVDDHSRSTRTLRVGHLDELAPGRDPDLDQLCSVILEGGGVLRPRAR